MNAKHWHKAKAGRRKREMLMTDSGSCSANISSNFWGKMGGQSAGEGYQDMDVDLKVRSSWYRGKARSRAVSSIVKGRK